MKTILPIEKAGDRIGGGKAKGLAMLDRWGFSIPLTYLVVDYDECELDEFLATHAADGVWAVRSSASGEDGMEHSFAGQYETFLNLAGSIAIKKAIKSCMDSMSCERATAYKDATGVELQLEKMFVLLQHMIAPKVSGALFTADPVANHQDRLTISAIKGVSEDLMSGKADGENFQVFKASPDRFKSVTLDQRIVTKLVTQAMEIERRYGAPVDLEYAVDHQDRIWWLQLRPITGLDPVHLNELDHQPMYSKPIYTRGNIGEMMPGPVTPLTMSTFGRAIDWGLQRFYQESGALDEIRPDNLFVHSYYNHLFMDLNSLYIIARKVLLASKDNIDYSILGRKVPSESVQLSVPVWRGLVNFIKSYRFIDGAETAEKKLKHLMETLRFDSFDNVQDGYQAIDQRLQNLLDAYLYHYVASAQSGWFFAGILRIISKGAEPTAADNEMAARFFTNISDIESAQVLVAMDELAKIISSMEDVSEKFLDVSLARAYEYLAKDGPDQVQNAWKVFLQRHGHRCVREAELWEKEWSLEPAPVIESLRMNVGALLHPAPEKQQRVSLFSTKTTQGLGIVQRAALGLMLPKARRAVARRERTKGLAIMVQHKFKQAYRALSKLMIAEGLLDIEEDVFFLTHEELGRLVAGRNTEVGSLKETAKKRRKLYKDMLDLEFEDLYLGVPFPLEHKQRKLEVEQLEGTPVSRGIVHGKVRLVRSFEDAVALEQGEIMVAKYTDVGWTPYYSIISGLVTEIGSPLSHGAVVAREYGLPAIVGMKGALSTLNDGQMIRLDATNGRVELIN